MKSRGSPLAGLAGRSVTSTDDLSDAELAMIQGLARAGFQVAAQAVPSESPTGPEGLAARLAAKE